MRRPHFNTLILCNHCCTSSRANFSFSPSITKRIPSLSTPPLVEYPSVTLLLGHSSLTVSKELPMPNPPFVLKGTTVFPLRSTCVKKLFIGGGNCIPQVGN